MPTTCTICIHIHPCDPRQCTVVKLNVFLAALHDMTYNIISTQHILLLPRNSRMVSLSTPSIGVMANLVRLVKQDAGQNCAFLQARTWPTLMLTRMAVAPVWRHLNGTMQTATCGNVSSVNVSQTNLSQFFAIEIVRKTVLLSQAVVGTRVQTSALQVAVQRSKK